MHAITHEGVLAQKVEGHYVTDTEWKGTKGDTPHSEKRDDKLLTCETIWKASSNTGDYHDNMNLKMFMNWVEKKLIPTFAKLYPDKKMVLVCDNAAYHHKREIGSFGNSTKDELVDTCKKYDVDYIDVPVTNRRIAAMNATNNDNVMMVDDDMIRVTFDDEMFREKSSKSNPLIPTLEELKIGIILYFQKHNPSLLECKVTKLMSDHGHSILWTPPYSPHLQPIELFWAAGKNHAASMSHFDSTLYDTVMHLRQGWYGNAHLFQGNNNTPPEDYRVVRKSAVDFRKLFDHCVANANTMSIPLCAGLSGSIGNLIISSELTL
jgi:transposase